MIDTIYDFSRWLSKKKVNYDYLLILQPTSPLRTFKDINNVENILKKHKPNSLFSVSVSIEHPYVTITKNKKTWKKIFKTKKNFTRRQDFGVNSFTINGAIYAAHRKLIEKKILHTNKNHICYTMEKSKTPQIDDKDDVKIVSALLKNQNKSL